ncbi:hypothetical protein Trco_003083 [Trichoderma cornu-damae]|uniref:Uncharacterized protein n=1 Tax=Trichoderma cornu-damae TaxID=654480 RepID=A0A9P8QW49_9HYPO|nr:hypothetical protein Trco_003083 [Trichoderma cornu-damae]
MSRNIRQKYPATAAKAHKRRRGSEASSSMNLSDDDGYSAVEDISDSEDNDEEDVTAVEEENILIEGLPISSDAPRPQSDDDEEEEEEDDDDDGEEEEEEEVEEDEGVEGEAESEDGDGADGDADNASWAGILSDAEDGHASVFYHDTNPFVSDPVVERHVRFDVPDSDSDSTETEDDHADLFPDIFVSQNSLDPAFRKEIEHDPDESSGSGSFWDYHGQYGEAEEDDSESEAEEIVRQLSEDDPRTAMPISSVTNATGDFMPTFEEPLELDGYESDGDTTDEEDIPEPVIRKKTRRPSNTMSDEASDSEADSPVKSERGQPRVGRFKLDRSDKKPIAVLNPLTRKMMIFTPHRRRQFDLSPEQFNLPWAIEEQSSPLLSNSANMMLSAMFSSNTFGDFVNAQTMGPAEAFFPFPSEANVDDSSTSPSMDGHDDDDDDDEEKLNINDFITFGEADDDESSGDEGNDGKWGATPKRPTAASSDMGALSHLNSDTVGAFRRNQINQQLILSNQATQDSLAFSGPYNYTALRGLKSDRFDTAAIPLTPIRRHKKQVSDLARSPLESVSAKRKASSEASGSHRKRKRSISDVNFLRI